MDHSQSPDDLQQSRDIIKEMELIHQQTRDQNAYQKTTSWHQQSADSQVLDQADQLEQIIQQLNRIEEKLDSLERMLT